MSFTNQCILLCNFDERSSALGSENANKLRRGNWEFSDLELVKHLLMTQLEKESLMMLIKEKNLEEESLEKLLQIAICTFLTFCEQNWNPHAESIQLEHYFGMDWPKELDCSLKLQIDSEPLCVNVKHPELLYFSIQIFTLLCSIRQNLVHLWWYFRVKHVHQRLLEATSATLLSEIEIVTAKLFNELQSKLMQPRIKLVLLLEMAQAYLMYGRIQKVEEYLLKAREISGLKLELTGVLGKRTRYQMNSLPQLALQCELDANIDRPSAEITHGASVLPQEIELHDDIRLNKVDYSDKIKQAELPSLEQTICLLTVQYLQKSQPKDDLMSEELQPYIEAILSQKKGPWSTRVAALLIRCKLEANHKRTVERAMLQCETIVNDKVDVAATDRLSYLWASGLPPAWTWRQQLADLYLSMGLVKAALEEYHRLQLWEDVILCYTILQLRHKAAEVIQQQLDVKPTVKLYCLLGDATDDEMCYQKAWEFSNYKSSRAQRHWGNFLFDRKRFEECIPHYEKSVEINSIQESVWLRLGFAALETEKWELSAKAYRRYTYLNPNSFEAWNNLAKVYVKQGNKERAHRALLEALKFNYDNWKLWENVVLVSMDTGHFEDVIRGCHRLLDIRHKFEDIEVLQLLVRAVISDKQDADGNGAGRLRKRVLELFGRVTSIHQNKPEIWICYSDLSPTNLLKAQRLLKAYRGFIQNGLWSNSPDTCKKVLDLGFSLLECSLKARQEADEKDILQANQQLSSARLIGQSIIKAVEKQDWQETKDSLKDLSLLFSNVTEYMKSLL